MKRLILFPFLIALTGFNLLSQTKTEVFYSDPADGWIRKGIEVNPITKLRVAGYWDGGEVYGYRSFVTFDISNLIGAEITEANVYFYQSGIDGCCFLDTRLTLVDYGDTLDQSDWGTDTIFSLGNLTTSMVIKFWGVDITGAVKWVLDQGHSRIQLTIDFKNLATAGYVTFEPGESNLIVKDSENNDVSAKPTLWVDYESTEQPSDIPSLVFSQYANGLYEGSISKTRVILYNSSDQTDKGEIVFRTPSGQLAEVPSIASL